MAMAAETPVSSNNPIHLPGIPEVFQGKCVFVTGATGFIGKVLVEKLLRSCPGIQRLYILIRPHEKGNVIERFGDFLEDKVFDNIRKDGSGALMKIRDLNGDIEYPRLGLDDCQYELVLSEVSFVFHCAANMQLDDEPRSVMKTNLLGVDNLMHVCKLCSKLEAIVYVSAISAFSWVGTYCEELFYPEVHPHQILQTLSWMTSDQFSSLLMHFVPGELYGNRFSKEMAETLVHVPVCISIPDTEPSTCKLEKLPVIIVRPTAVTAAVNEPFPGWIDNDKGTSGFLAECQKGTVRTLLVNHVNADWIPVDTVVNTLIAAAHYVVVKSKMGPSSLKLNEPMKIPVVDCTCPKSNLITWKEMMEIGLPFLVQYPSMQIYGKPGVTITTCPLQYNFRLLMSHYIPAILIDVARCLTLKKPRMICRYKSIHRDMNHLRLHFADPIFGFSDNMLKLSELMSPEDKEVFSIDLSTLDWTVYMEHYVLGLRRFLLKERDETLTEARTKMMRIHYSWLGLKMCGIFLVLRVLMKSGYIYFPRSLLSTFPYITSTFAFIQNKLTSPLQK